MSSISSSSSSSSSSFGASNLPEFDEWRERIHEENRRTDRIIEDVFIHTAIMSIQPTDHTARARRRYIDRKREKGHKSLFEQYFSDDPIYPPEIFRAKFRMRKPLFERIMDKIVATDEYFQQKRDASGRPGMSSIQKCTAAMRVLAYGAGANLHDEHLRMSTQTMRNSVVQFVEGIISNFGNEYLRKPTEEDMIYLLQASEERGFPGMLGSIGCINWELKNCPPNVAEQYGGKCGKPTIIFEAAASQDLWIWHALFGTPDTRNGIKVLGQSPNFSDILEGEAPKVSYIVNGHEYNMGYYFTDDKYPRWAAFIKSIICPLIRKHKLFVQLQETARKDVERAFSVLQARFAFIKQPCLIWDRDMMGKIMIACIIMHNMIVEDERTTHLNYRDPTEFMEAQSASDNSQSGDEEDSDDPNFEFSTKRIASLVSCMTNKSQLENRIAHMNLRDDLIEHVWQKLGISN